MKLDLINDIKPISEIRANAANLLKQVKTSKRPIVITQNGRSTAVIIDIEEYQKLQDELDLIKAIVEGEEDIANERTVPYKKFMKSLKERVNKK